MLHAAYPRTSRMALPTSRVKLIFLLLVLLAAVAAALPNQLLDLTARLLPEALLTETVAGPREVFHTAEKSAELASVAPAESR